MAPKYDGHDVIRVAPQHDVIRHQSHPRTVEVRPVALLFAVDDGSRVVHPRRRHHRHGPR